MLRCASDREKCAQRKAGEFERRGVRCSVVRRVAAQDGMLFFFKQTSMLWASDKHGIVRLFWENF
jgi:hypothetical protein